MKAQYSILLSVANVILLLASTILVFLGCTLIFFYHLDKLDFVSVWFPVVPYVFISLGVGSFVVALFGCAVAFASSRPLLFVYALLLMVVFGTQLAGIFSAMELKSIILQDDLSNTDVLSDLDDYMENPATQAKWDALHRQFQCCGGFRFNSGYEVWRNADIGRSSNSLPDSCCQMPVESCGAGVFDLQPHVIARKINTHGCMTVIQEKLRGQVVPVLLAFTAVGTCLALLQLLAIVFACAYASAISRETQAAEDDDMRSLRSGGGAGDAADHTYLRAASLAANSRASTPKFDHIIGGGGGGGVGGYGRDNIAAAYERDQHEDDKYSQAYETAGTSRARDV